MDQQLKQKLDAVTTVNYIKLGSGGSEAKKCFEDDLVHIGFDTDNLDFFNACDKKQWAEVEQSLKKNYKKNTATYAYNVLKRFFDDNGDALWITFHNDTMYWCFMEPDSEFRDPKDDYKAYKSTQGKWRCTNIKGETLKMVDLAGSLTQSHAYRGTSFEFDKERSKYVILKIKGEETEEVKKAKDAKDQFTKTLKPLIKMLTPKDFELLIELIFAQSGWKRITTTGGITKFHDGVMEQPVIDERAAIQVKSQTTESEFNYYISEFKDRDKIYNRFYYIYHTFTGSGIPDQSNENIQIWNCDRVAEELLKAGLVDWLIKRVG